MQVELKVPALPESVTEGTLGDWHKKVGDSVAVDENVVDLETDKVVLEIVAASAGVIESVSYESGDTVKDGDVLAIINTEASAAPSDEKADKGEESSGADESAKADKAPESEEHTGPGKASPSVRKLLNEHNLSADDVRPSGKKGAITKEDVEKHLQQQASAK
ncbi:MAG: biotin/lipoyl-binding protein, partial [Gammaproteobacteria bacterium]|nr:biotin/lipoyl-binding protein [Gammaproteobacteria bacterium]